MSETKKPDDREATIASLRAEVEALRARQRRLERTGFGVVMLDTDRVVTSTSGPICEQLRITLGASLDDALPLSTREGGRVAHHDHPFAMAYRGEVVLAREFYVTPHPSAAQRIAIAAWPTDQGGVEAWILGLGEIDDLERTALHRAIDAAQFSRLATHDLSEPLRKVYSLLELIEEDNRGKLANGSDELLAHASDGARRLRKALSQLLRLSRITNRSPTRNPIALAALVDDFEQRHEDELREKNAVIDRAALPTVSADPQQLAQVIDALLANGLRFAGEKPAYIRVSATVHNKTCTVHIDDSGIGIEPQFRDIVFDMFRRLHGRSLGSGAGLGLTICRRIIDEHGGRIWIEDGPSGETRVSFTIAAGTPTNDG